MVSLISLSLLMLLLFSGVTAEGGGDSCSTSLECWLNGECIKNQCVCDQVWTGGSCNILLEQASDQIWPPVDPLPSNISQLPSSWGASVIKDPDTGLYHAYIEVVCRFFTWMHISGSVVVHATATSITGPYTFADVALPQQSMTPHIVRDTDGAWLLLHQRNASVVGDPECTGGDYESAVSSYNPLAPNTNNTFWDGPPSIARSMSLSGPWTPYDFNITPPVGRVIVNPNPSLLPLPANIGGGYLLAFTSQPINTAHNYSEAVSLAFAQDWRSGIFTPIVGNGAPAPDILDCEDSHLYATARGLHIVCHRRGVVNPWNYSQTGGYGVSVDGKQWVFSPTAIYNTSIPWAPLGGAPFTFGRRERPEFLMGPSGSPLYLLTGVELVTGVLGKPSMSVLTPLGPAPPPPSGQRRYTVTVSEKSPKPVISIGLPKGTGHSPCNLTFNPAWLDAHPPGLNQSIVFLRVSGCPLEYGGVADHLLYASCTADGVCGDVQPLAFPFGYLSEDPRSYWNPDDNMFYLYYFANGTNQSTVFLRRTATPLIPSSWELVASALPWHRNGCAFFANGKHYVLYGETYYPAYPGKYIGGIGIATTVDWSNYTVLDATFLNPVAHGPEPEVCLEAATPPVLLSSGDWLHMFAAGTQGWGPWGSGVVGTYVGGWVILSGDDPSVIVQRSVTHPFSITMDYERGDNPQWPVYRNNTLFVTSLVPIPEKPDSFRAWYGAADANVATAIITVTIY